MSKLCNKTVQFHSGKGVLLCSYSWGGNARRIQAMSHKDAINECLKLVSKVHGIKLSYVKSQFVEGHVKNWGLDPFSMGAFVHTQPFHVISHKIIKLKKPKTLVKAIYGPCKSLQMPVIQILLFRHVLKC